MAIVSVLEIDNAIGSIIASGVKVNSNTHAIYAAKDTIFLGGIYPLQIVTGYEMPKDTIVIIAKKDIPENRSVNATD